MVVRPQGLTSFILLALLMGFQAGLPPLDFGGWSGKGERPYIAAIPAAVGSNYQPMVDLFSEVIRRSYDRFGRPTIRTGLHKS